MAFLSFFVCYALPCFNIILFSFFFHIVSIYFGNFVKYVFGDRIDALSWPFLGGLGKYVVLESFPENN